MDPHGKDAETAFRVLERNGTLALIEAKPVTGRTHQIRLHLGEAGLPIIGDKMYGAPEDRAKKNDAMALRAVELEFEDPFSRRRVRITAPREEFVQQFLGKAATIPVTNTLERNSPMKIHEGDKREKARK